MVKGILASANVDALKSKELRETINQAIDKAGRYCVYSTAILGISLMATFGALDAAEGLGAIVAGVAAATGVELAVSKRAGKETNVEPDKDG